MAKFGDYTTGEVLQRTSLGCVYSASRDSTPGGAAFVVKTCEPDAAVLGSVEADETLVQFLAAAEAQRKFGAMAGSGVAPIHAMGRFTGENGEGAYYVTDRAVRGSCERLTDGARPIDARGLSNIVGQIAAALTGLRQSAGRVHGNLHPSNVLLMDDAPPATARVMLCDPVADEAIGRDANEAWRRERRALGEIIYRMVMRRGFSGGWPVADSPQWAALGGTGSAWRDLCNKLLDPSPESPQAPGITIEQVGGLIPVDRAGAGQRRKAILAGAALALVIAAVVVGYFAFRGKSLDAKNFTQFLADPEGVRDRWQSLVSAFDPEASPPGWVAQLRRAADPAPARGESERRSKEALLRSCPALVERSRELGKEELQPLRIGGFSSDTAWTALRVDPAKLRDLLSDPSPSSQQLQRYKCLSDESVEKTRAALAEVEKLSSFAKTEWPPGRDLKAVLTASDKWPDAWGGAKKELADASEALNRFDRPGEDAAAILDAVSRGAAPAATVARLIGEIQPLTDQIASAAKDDVSRAFAANWPAIAAAGAGAGDGQTGAGAVESLAKQLESVKALAVQVAAALTATGASELDPDDLRAQIAAAGLNTRSLTPADINLWLDRARGSVKLPGEPPVVALSSRFKDATGIVEQYSGHDLADESRKREFAASRDRIASRLAELGNLRAVVRNKSRFETEGAAIESDIAALRTAASAELDRARRDMAAGLAGLLTRIRSDAEWAAISSESVRTLGRARLEVIASEPNAGVKRVGSELERIKRLLMKFDSEIPGAKAPDVSRADVADWERALADTAATGREREIAKAVAAPELATGELSEEVLARAAETVNRSVGERLTRMEALIADMRAMDDLLRTRFSLTDGGEAGGGSTAQSLWDKWNGPQEQLTKEADVLKALTPLDAKVALYRAFETMPSTDLIAAIEKAPAAQFDVAVAAWERLTSSRPVVAWPTTLEEFRRAPDLHAKVRSLVAEGESKAERRGAVEDRLKRRLAAAWNDFAERQTRAGGADKTARSRALTAGLASMAEFGVDPATIRSPRVGLSAALMSFHKSLDAAKDDAAAKQATEQFARVVGSLKFEQPEPKLAGLLKGLSEQILNAPEGPKVTELGPGQAGCGGRVLDDGRVEFEIGREKMVFASATGESGEAFYLAEQEMSVKLFLTIVTQKRANWGDIVNNGWLDGQPDDGSWSGPSAWAWIEDPVGIKASGSWISPTLSAKFRGRPAHAGGEAERLPSAMGVEPKSTDMPMHRIAAAGAEQLAALVGCRLPTTTEWLAAYRSLGRGPGSSDNLRDQTFGVQNEYAKVGLAGPPPGTPDIRSWSRQDFLLPDAGSFAPGGAPPSGDNDQVLYFRPVSQGGTDRFTNLIGNVAEFVKSGAGFAVLGASALSDPSIAPSQPKDVGGEPKWDVGFRLAFGAKDAKLKPLARVATEFMDSQLGESILVLD